MNVGYFSDPNCNDILNELLCLENISMIQDKIKKNVKHPKNLPIVVTDNAIKTVIRRVYQSSKRKVGDLYNQQFRRDDINIINEKVLDEIATYIQNDLYLKYRYENFSIWKTDENKTKNNNIKLTDRVKSASIPLRF